MGARGAALIAGSMMGKAEPVKNKQPAPMQITAEQILREARERQEDDNYTAPAQKLMDADELAVYRMRERKHFEDRLRMNRCEGREVGMGGGG